MNPTWQKIISVINRTFTPKVEKDYATGLVDHLKQAKNNRQRVPFEITSAERKGFMVKVGGLPGFIALRYMPWEYHSAEHWRAVSKHLIGKVFSGEIHSIEADKTPIQIRINAQDHRFKDVPLIEGQQYEGVVIHKAKYGLFVDLGYHSTWEYGSIVGLMHESTYENDDSLLTAEIGEVVKTYFHGIKKHRRHKNGAPVLGGKSVPNELFPSQLERLIGTNQTAVVMEDENGKKSFFIDGKYKTTIHLDQDRFPNKKSLKKELKNLDINSFFSCNVLRITRKNDLVAELLAVKAKRENS